jgi:nucleotide-binding universal stress UspA family protein
VVVVLELARSAYVRRKMRILLAIEDWPDPAEVAETITSQGWPPDTEVRVLSIVQKGVPPSTSSAKREQRAEKPANEMPKQVEELTTRVANILRANDLTAVVRSGETPKAIVDEARDWSADLIVVSGHFDTAIQGWVSDSTARWVVDHAPCSVKVVSMAQGK